MLHGMFLLGHITMFGDENAKLIRSLCLPLHMHALQRGQPFTILPFSIASQSHGPVGAPRNSDIGKKKTYANFVFNKVEEFSIMVEEAIFLIEKVLLPNCHRTHNTVNVVFFYKCKGDFLRYLLHFKSGEPKNKLIRRSDKAYVYGYRIAQKGEMGLAEPLIPSHPMRLAISLNYSVYLYTVKKERRRAAGHCKQAFDAAVAWVDRLSEDNYADATHLMKQMRDNLNNWLGQDLSSLITFSITG